MSMKEGNLFFRRWVLACGTAEFLGIGIAAGVAGLTLYWIGEPQTAFEKIGVLVSMMVAGSVEGWLVGAFQAGVLVEKIPNLSRAAWIRATVLVAAAGWFLGMLPSTLLSGSQVSDPQPVQVEPSLWVVALVAVGMGLVLGAIFGWAQQRVLRRYVRGSGRWIVANSLAWGAGLWWVYLGASWPDGSEPIWQIMLSAIISGVLMGLTVGVVTGLFLKKMLQ